MDRMIGINGEGDKIKRKKEGREKKGYERKRGHLHAISRQST